MNIEEALYLHLIAEAGVSALVGTRIYPNVAPQEIAKPNLAYQRISATREMYHAGPAGLAEARFQFTCTAGTYRSAKAVINALRQALDGYSGMMGGADGVEVEGAFVETDFDGYNQESSDQVIRLDVMILHQET